MLWTDCIFYATFTVLLIISIYDAYTRRIPNLFVIILAITSVTCSLLLTPEIWLHWSFDATVAGVVVVWLCMGKYLLGSGDFKLTLSVLPIIGILHREFIFIIWIGVIWAVQTLIISVYQKLLHKRITVPFAYAVCIAFIFSVYNITLF